MPNERRFGGLAVLLYSGMLTSCRPELRYRTPSESGGPLPNGAVVENAARPAHPAARPPARSSDTDLLDALRRVIDDDASLGAHRVDVAVRDGVAILSGPVASGLAAQRVVHRVEATRGVLAIIDRLEVQAPAVADSEIEAALRDLLASDPATAGAEVDIAVDKGQATLAGEVDVAARRTIAAQLAWSVRGVSAVRNEIVLVPSGRADAEIQRDIERRLAIDALLHAQRILVLVNGAKVMLEGGVPSLLHKRHAREGAEISGVMAVDDARLWVEPTEPGSFSPQVWSNAQVAAASKDALRHDPRLTGARLGVRARRSTVTLSGQVRSLLARLSAEQGVFDTVGVWEVDNALQVRPEANFPDETLVKRVRQRFQRHATLSADQVQVEVADGKVVLRGEVTSDYQRSQALVTAAAVPGVIAIDNRLSIDSIAPLRDDAAIENAIEACLSWDARLTASMVEVDVHDGVVVLRGKVGNRIGYDAILETALAARPREVVSGLRRDEPTNGSVDR